MKDKKVVKKLAGTKSTSPQKKSSAIDAIFSNLKQKDAKETKSTSSPKIKKSITKEKTKGKSKQKPEEKQQRVNIASQEDGNLFNIPKGESKVRGERKKKDGLSVYTTEELNIGRGGNTAQCPFDCDCCF